MTAVLVPCHHCNNNVQIDSRQITVQVCKDDQALTHYDFTCPACGQQQANPGSTSSINALINADCPVKYWSKLEQHPRPAFTWDDLLDFHHSIDSELNVLLRGAA